MSIDDKRRYAAAAFVTLLALSVFWPSPVVSVNRLCCNALLGVDELSFLGRETVVWDVAFWCIAGLLALALIDPSADYREPWRMLRAMRFRLRATDALAIVAAAAAVVAVWLVADAPVSGVQDLYRGAACFSCLGQLGPGALFRTVQV